MKYDKMTRNFSFMVKVETGGGLLVIVFALLKNFVKNSYISILADWVFALYVLFLVIYIVYFMILIIKNGMHNTRKCDVPIFDELDEYGRCWGMRNEHYVYMIQVIKLYYLESDKVDKLIENRQLEDLYKRYDTLKNRNASHEYIISSLNAILLSIIASGFYTFVNSEVKIGTFVTAILMFFAFFTVLMLKYVERGHGGSFRYLTSEYELKLLEEKIKMVYEKITVKAEDEEGLLLKREVLNKLIDIRKKRFIGKALKKEVEQDINLIEKLNLSVEEYEKYQKHDIYIDDNKYYLLYKKEQGKENNYIGENNLANEDFVLLYGIMNKYKMFMYR